MADDPNPSEPFDPIFHIASRYKCPGMHRIIRPAPAIIRIPKEITYAELAPVVRRRRYCGVQHKTAIVMKRTNPCDIKRVANPFTYRFVTAVVSDNVQSPEPVVANRVCDRKRSSTLVPFGSHKRIVCIRTQFASFDADWACRSTPRGHAMVIMPLGLTNAGQFSCKAPKALRLEDYVNERVCVRKHHTIFDDSVLYKGVFPRSNSWACRSYPLIQGSLPTGRTCNTIKSTQLLFTYRVYGGPFSCKITPLSGGNIGKRWRCGTVLLTTVPLRLFGRIWGGKLGYNGFQIESGRMIARAFN